MIRNLAISSMLNYETLFLRDFVDSLNGDHRHEVAGDCLCP